MIIDVDARLGLDWQRFADQLSYNLPGYESLKIAKQEVVVDPRLEDLLMLSATKNGITVFMPIGEDVARDSDAPVFASYLGRQIEEDWTERLAQT